jgi:hypothetical protein
VARKPPTSPTAKTPPSSGATTSARPRRTDPETRKARIAEVQKAQKSRERRTVLLIVASCAALVVLLAGVITFGILDARNNQPESVINTVGVAMAAASCDPVTTDAAAGNADHQGAGTNKPSVKKIAYSTVPPTSGPHFVQPNVDGRQFFTPTDSPAVETLVHNLEHGYTVLWYAPSEATTSADQLKEIATLANKLTPSQSKFIVAPLPEGYGTLPDGKKFALSHWSATTDATSGAVQSQTGHRMICGSLSGEAVQSFVTSFPRTDAPEPRGA